MQPRLSLCYMRWGRVSTVRDMLRHNKEKAGSGLNPLPAFLSRLHGQGHPEGKYAAVAVKLTQPPVSLGNGPDTTAAVVGLGNLGQAVPEDECPSVEIFGH